MKSTSITNNYTVLHRDTSNKRHWLSLVNMISIFSLRMRIIFHVRDFIYCASQVFANKHFDAHKNNVWNSEKNGDKSDLLYISENTICVFCYTQLFPQDTYFKIY